jgi:hypothetical protein
MRLIPVLLAGALAYVTGPDLAHPARSFMSVAAASTFVELTVAELLAGSRSVVCATPQERLSVWEDSGGAGRRIVTYTHVRVDRVLDGLPGAEVWVRTLGGVVDDIGQRVEGEAVLSPGQPVLLFLTPRADGTHSVVGMGQGHYLLEIPPGQAMRVAAARPLGLMLPRPGLSVPKAPAHLDLPGRTVDEVAQMITSLRHAHAP